MIRIFTLPAHILVQLRYLKPVFLTGVEKVTEGVHNMGPLNFKSGVLVAGLVSMSMAPEISVVEMKTGAVKQISFINKPIYENIKMGKVEEKYIKTKDNKDLQMWMIYPPDFDPPKNILLCFFVKEVRRVRLIKAGHTAGTIR